MSLLEHNGFKFKNILSKGYNLKEDEAEVLSSITMSDGSIRVPEVLRPYMGGLEKIIPNN